AGCRTTAELWEAQKRTDAASLYKAAVCRAVTANVTRTTDTSPAAAKKADAEANLALAWLQKAVAEGSKDAAQVANHTDFDALRDREDYKKLVAGLEAKKE